MATKPTKSSSVITRKSTETVKRKGVHSKKKTSKLKTSKLYKKSYRGQGR